MKCARSCSSQTLSALMVGGVCAKVCRQESEHPVSVKFYVCLLFSFCHVCDVFFVQECFWLCVSVDCLSKHNTTGAKLLSYRKSTVIHADDWVLKT